MNKRELLHKQLFRKDGTLSFNDYVHGELSTREDKSSQYIDFQLSEVDSKICKSHGKPGDEDWIEITWTRTATGVSRVIKKHGMERTYFCENYRLRQKGYPSNKRPCWQLTVMMD